MIPRETKCHFFKKSVASVVRATYFWACWVVSSGNEQPFLQVGELLKGIRDHLDDLWLQVGVPLPWHLATVASLLLTGSKRAAICHGHSCIPLVRAAPLHLTVGLKPFFKFNFNYLLCVYDKFSSTNYSA
jgi:hypothetical protein